MIRAARAGIAALSAVLLSTSIHPAPLAAQGVRDSLVAGRHAYERAEFDAAVRLLRQGIAGGANARDTMWVGGAHMLTDALLNQHKDTLALLWARWIMRAAPGMAIDSSIYPPAVAQTFLRAKAALAATEAADTMATTSLEPASDSTRGVLKTARGNVSAEALVEGVGLMLSQEMRTIAPGTYAIRFSAPGYAPLVLTREVLPGFVTVVTPRMARAAAPPRPVATTPSANPSATTTGSAAAARGTTFTAAGANTCAVLESITACWGDNRAGQLGSGAMDSLRAPAAVAGGQTFQIIAVGPSHACGINTAGKAYCWGQGANGQLGTGQAAASPAPVAVNSSLLFVGIAAGTNHSCALTASGAVYCWGSNGRGELGTRNTTPSGVPVPVAAPQGVSFTTVAAGGSHSCAIASNGALYCWGENGNGQDGAGSTSDVTAPAPVQGINGQVRQVVLGTTHTCALTASNATYCWGSNTNGQLGLGASGPPQATRATPIADSSAFASIGAGDAHTCGLKSDGAAYCWGSNRAGQLGNGQMTDSPRPVLVVGGHVFRNLTLGAAHSCGMTADAIVFCWGDNSAGQLGGIAGRASAIPVAVVVRPPAHSAPVGLLPARVLRENFEDGNWNAAPTWDTDASGVPMSAADHFFEMSRGRGRLAGAGGGLAIPLRIPVKQNTQIQFDIMVLADTTRTGCGLNCATWPAVVRVRVKNTDLTESEVWYAYGDHGGSSRTLGNVVIVAKGDAEPGHWYRQQVFSIKEALPRADTILQVSVGSTGAAAGARFDNIFLPLPIPTTIVLAPDNVQIPALGATKQLTAAVHDSAGTEMPGIRVTWSSSDTTVATVDASGLVTAVAGGRAMIRAAAGAIRDSVAVTVAVQTPRPAAPATRRRAPTRRP